MKVLEPYQQEVADEILSKLWAEDKWGRVLCMKTGAGKTVTATYIADQVIDQAKRVLMLAHSTILVKQFDHEAKERGIPSGTYFPERKHPNANTLPFVAGTYVSVRNAIQKYPLALGRFGLVIVDECHHIAPWVDGSKKTPNIYSMLMDKFMLEWKGCRILGLSATPERLDGAGLGERFDGITMGPSFMELVEAGRLMVPTGKVLHHYYGISVRKGEYDMNQVTRSAMMDDALNARLVKDLKGIPGHRAIVFCANIEHCKFTSELLERELDAPYPIITAATDDQSRGRIIDNLAKGRIGGIVNVNVLTEGVDVPVADVCVNLAPTKSYARLMQRVGRVVRTAPGKTRAIILDYAGSIREHGLPEIEREFSLRQGKRGENPAPVKVCDECGRAQHASAKVCIECGKQFISEQAKPEKSVEVSIEEMRAKSNELFQMASESSLSAVRRAVELETRSKDCAETAAKIWERHIGTCRIRGWKPGRAYYLMADEIRAILASGHASHLEPLEALLGEDFQRKFWVATSAIKSYAAKDKEWSMKIERAQKVKTGIAG